MSDEVRGRGRPKGQPRTGGRKKGTPNKRSIDAQRLAEEIGCDPLEVLLRIAMGDWKWLGLPNKYKDPEAKLKRPAIDLYIREKAASDAAPFVRPTLKAMEFRGEASEALKSFADLMKSVKDDE